ncbi:MAG: WecB/TagA/CpsF family glycosyltransferase [Lentisphaerae bacterium]|nr:WecB/TagA/CpsF family glycosyltransferase [Lentisphaerota bacterium]
MKTRDIHILGVKISLLNTQELLDAIADYAARGARATIASGNVHAVNTARRDSGFRDFLNGADIVRLDGAGVRLGARLLGYRLPSRNTWADFGWSLARFCSERGLSLFFFGARPGVAVRAADRLRRTCPALRIAGVEHGFIDRDFNAAACRDLVERINRAAPDILIVGLGMPVQERWIRENRSRLAVPVVMTGGAVFDYLAGEVKRAPRWMLHSGLEWLYRLCQDPRGKWRRYLAGNPAFLWRVLRERLRGAARCSLVLGAVLALAGAAPVAAESYAAWAERVFGAASGVARGTADDPDTDGHVNFSEYAFGGCPTNPESCLYDLDVAPGAEDGPELRLHYAKGTAENVTYWVEWAADLKALHWTSEGIGRREWDASALRYYHAVPLARVEPSAFFRMKAAQPPRLFEQRFVSGGDSTSYACLEAEAPSNTAVRLCFDNGTNRCLELIDLNAADGPDAAVILGQTGACLTVSWRFRMTDPGAFVMELGDGAASLISVTTASGSGVPRLLAPVETNLLAAGAATQVWRRVSVVLDRQAGTCGIWCDGVRQAWGLPLAGIPVGRLRVRGGEAAQGTLWLDDIFVYEGRRPAEIADLPLIFDTLNGQYAAFLSWLAPLFDPCRGGFYHQHSSLTDTNRFFPTVETTGQALSVLDSADLLESMPADMKDALLSFFAERQDSDGFFRDGVPELDDSASQIGRNLNFAKAAYRRLQSVPAAGMVSTDPPHPYPAQPSVLEQYPELETADSFQVWLQGLDWSNPYTSGGRIASRSGALMSLEEAHRGALIGVMTNFLCSIQSSSTGLWGADSGATDWGYVNGAFKIILAHGNIGITVPRGPRIYDSMMRCLRTERININCEVGNAVTLVRSLRKYLPWPIPEYELAEIAGLLTAVNGVFRQDDGGFSRWRDRSVAGSLAPLGLGLAEGGMGSAGQAAGPIRLGLHQMTGRAAPPLTGRAEFYDTVDGD